MAGKYQYSWEHQSGYKPLIGATVSKVEFPEDGVVLHTDKGKFLLNPVGDCCSTSWFEKPQDEIEGLVGATIESIEEVDGPVSGSADDGEEMKTYFVKFRTSKGRATLEMRNESNGYYGGEVIVVKANEDGEFPEP